MEEVLVTLRDSPFLFVVRVAGVDESETLDLGDEGLTMSVSKYGSVADYLVGTHPIALNQYDAYSEYESGEQLAHVVSGKVHGI